MSVFVQYGRICNYTDTLTVSGNGSFTFDYLYPYLYVTDEGAAGAGVFTIYDITDPANPALKSTQNTGASTKPRNPKFYLHPNGTPLCLIPCNQSLTLQIWDVSNPVSPSKVAEPSVSFAPYAVAAIGTKACVAYFDGFLQTKSAEIWDISTPSSPVVGGNWAASKLCSSIIASRTEFLLSGQNSSGGPSHLTAIDGVTAALKSTVTGGGSFAGIAQYLAVSKDGNTAFFTNDGNGALMSVNASNRSSLSIIQTLTGQYSAGSGPVIDYLEGMGRLYLGRGSGGGLQIYIFNVSDTSNMSLAGTINTSGETVTDIQCMNDYCPGLIYAQGTGASIHLLGVAPLS